MIKKFNQFHCIDESIINDLDPYGEEIWDDKDIQNLIGYSKIDGAPIYMDETGKAYAARNGERDYLPTWRHQWNKDIVGF